VHRVVVDFLQNLNGFGRFYAGADPEPDAAMPSLHVTVPMLIACTIIGLAQRPRRLVWLWLLYPLTLAFGVVYLGEHYIADSVAGLLLGVVCYVVVDRLHASRSPVMVAEPVEIATPKAA
jgi:membrane-associated phospholipid phosphatase